MKKIIHQELNLPSEAPVMILPDAALFPNSLLPLFIFEERYRSMLDFCLHRDRVFCIAQMKPGVGEAVLEEDFHHVAGLGFIRACVGNPDGTSHLMLQGLARVKLMNFVQHEPFLVAQIRELQSRVDSAIQAEALSAKVLELCGELSEATSEMAVLIKKQLSRPLTPDAVSDLVSQALIRDPVQRQEILEELSVCQRLRTLISVLQNGN